MFAGPVGLARAAHTPRPGPKPGPNPGAAPLPPSPLVEDPIPEPPPDLPPVLPNRKPAVPADAPAPGGQIQRFAPPAWGYRIDLPGDWPVTTPSPYTMVASGPEGTTAFTAPIALQNRRAPVPDDPGVSAERVLAAHRDHMRARLDGLRVLREALFRPPDGAADGGRGDLPPGRQLVMEWPGPDGVMRQWAVARPRPRAAVVHLWTYTAERSVFATWLPVARAVLDSWSLVGR